MLQTIIGFAVFILIIFAISGIASFIRRSDTLSSIFKSLGKVLFIILQLVLFLGFTIIISLLVGLIITIHLYIFGAPQFLTGGEGVHLLASSDDVNRALLQFSLTYGLLYMGVFFIFMRYMTKNRVTWFFVDLIRNVRMRLPYRRNLRNLESRLFVTACQIMTVITLLILYPIVIALFFPKLEISFNGNLFIFLALFVFSVFPSPKHVNRNATIPTKDC